MTSRLVRNARMGPRRESAFKRDRICIRRTVGPKKNPKKVTKADSSSWWTGLKDRIVSTDSETGTAEFASWTIMDVCFGDNYFLGECMALLEEWTWCDEDRKMMNKYFKTRLPCGSWLEESVQAKWCGWWHDNKIRDELGSLRLGGGIWHEKEDYHKIKIPSYHHLVWYPCACQVPEWEIKKLAESMKLFREWTGEDEELEEGMTLFAEWTATAEDEDEFRGEETDMKIVRTVSEICTAEFASWTIFAQDLGDDEFLGECMALFGDWAWCDEERKLMKKKYMKRRLPCGFCWREESITPWWWGWSYDYRITDENGTFVCGGGSNCGKDYENAERRQREDQRYDETRSPRVRGPCACRVPRWKNQELKESMKLFAEWTDEYEELEEGMKLFAEWIATVDDEEEIMAEPETHDSQPMAALLSTTEPLPSGISCQDLLMASLAVLLFETRHLHYINEILALPPAPKWMLEAAREMDPFKSTVTEVAETSSSSSLSTLFMDPSSAHSSSSTLLTSSLSSLFAPCHCTKCQPAAHSAQSTTDSGVESTDSHHDLSSSSGYESDVYSEPVVLKKMTTTVCTQTEEPSQSSAAQMLANCDEMMEKLVEMKKRLRELL